MELWWAESESHYVLFTWGGYYRRVNPKTTAVKKGGSGPDRRTGAPAHRRTSAPARQCSLALVRRCASAPAGWRSERWVGSPKSGAWRVEGPTFRAVFPSAANFVLSSLSWGLLVELWPRRHKNHTTVKKHKDTTKRNWPKEGITVEEWARMISSLRRRGMPTAQPRGSRERLLEMILVTGPRRADTYVLDSQLHIEDPDAEASAQLIGLCTCHKKWKNEECGHRPWPVGPLSTQPRTFVFDTHLARARLGSAAEAQHFEKRCQDLLSTLRSEVMLLNSTRSEAHSLDKNKGEEGIADRRLIHVHCAFGMVCRTRIQCAQRRTQR